MFSANPYFSDRGCPYSHHYRGISESPWLVLRMRLRAILLPKNSKEWSTFFSVQGNQGVIVHLLETSENLLDGALFTRCLYFLTGYFSALNKTRQLHAQDVGGFWRAPGNNVRPSGTTINGALCQSSLDGVYIYRKHDRPTPSGDSRTARELYKNS